jgi:hypothetical protein
VLCCRWHSNEHARCSSRCCALAPRQHAARQSCACAEAFDTPAVEAATGASPDGTRACPPWAYEQPSGKRFDSRTLPRIRAAGDWREVQAILRVVPHTDGIDVAAALQACHHLLGRGVLDLPPADADELRAFVHNAAADVAALAAHEPLPRRSTMVVNVLLSLARLHTRPVAPTLLALCGLARGALSRATPQSLANAALAAALLGLTEHDSGGLLSALRAECSDQARAARLAAL